jgi:hypothetical protein
MAQFSEEVAEFRRTHRPWNPMMAGLVVFMFSAAGLIYAWGFKWGTPLLLALFLGLLARTITFYRNIHVLDKFIATMETRAGQGPSPPHGRNTSGDS